MVKSFPTTKTKKLLFLKIHFVSFMTLIMFDYETAIVKKALSILHLETIRNDENYISLATHIMALIITILTIAKTSCALAVVDVHWYKCFGRVTVV